MARQGPGQHSSAADEAAIARAHFWEREKEAFMLVYNIWTSTQTKQTEANFLVAARRLYNFKEHEELTSKKIDAVGADLRKRGLRPDVLTRTEALFKAPLKSKHVKYGDHQEAAVVPKAGPPTCPPPTAPPSAFKPVNAILPPPALDPSEGQPRIRRQQPVIPAQLVSYQQSSQVRKAEDLVSITSADLVDAEEIPSGVRAMRTSPSSAQSLVVPVAIVTEPGTQELLNDCFDGEVLFLGAAFSGAKKQTEVTFTSELARRDSKGRAKFHNFFQTVAVDNCDEMLVREDAPVLGAQGKIALLFKALVTNDVNFVGYCLDTQRIDPNVGIAIAAKNSAQTWFYPALHFAVARRCRPEIIKLLLDKGADSNAEIKRVSTLGDDVQLVALDATNPLSYGLVCQSMMRDDEELAKLLIEHGVRSDFTAAEAGGLLKKIIDDILGIMTENADEALLEPKLNDIAYLLANSAAIEGSALKTALGKITQKQQEFVQSRQAIDETCKNTLNEANDLISCRLLCDEGKFKEATVKNTDLTKLLFAKSVEAAVKMRPASGRIVKDDSFRKRLGWTGSRPTSGDGQAMAAENSANVPASSSATHEASAPKEPHYLRVRIKQLLYGAYSDATCGDKTDGQQHEEQVNRLKVAAEHIVAHFSTLADYKRQQLALLAEVPLRSNELTLGDPTLPNSLRRHGEATIKKLLSIQNFFQPKKNKALTQWRAEFYNPVLETLQFFDGYLNDKKEHAPWRLQYCAKFLADVKISYSLEAMDAPAVSLLTEFYKLKGMLLCELHDAAQSGDGYLSMLLSSRMTGTLASFVTEQISRLETMLDGAHKALDQKPQNKKKRVAQSGDDSTILNGLGADIKGAIKDGDREDVRALKQARLDNAPLEKLYGSVGSRITSFLFNYKPKRTSDEEASLEKTYSAWHKLTAPVVTPGASN